MDPDLAMAIGVVLGVFTVPSIMSAISDGRATRCRLCHDRRWRSYCVGPVQQARRL